MVHEYYVSAVRRISAERDRERRAVRTMADLRRLQAQARRRLARCFGPFPARTPLKARVTGVLKRTAYSVEKIVFESRPGLFVTANLYVPAGLRGPAPCVLGACGHSATGKAEPNYQFYAQKLARNGYLVMLYDPLSQGERIQYPAAAGRAGYPKGCCQEHNMMGNQMSLIGEFFGQWRLWDGIRALDYLLSRPEADPKRVGVTGNSGGGTLTTYLYAFDERFTMAAPSCFVTTYLANLENELPADSEQIPPGILAAGLDMADFFVPRIPCPVILLGQNNDYFDRRGLEKTYCELKRLYAIAGAAGNIELFIGPRGHGYSVENRMAMYAFFNRHAEVAAGVREGLRQTEPSALLEAAPQGRVARLRGKRVFDFTREMAAIVNSARPPVSGSALVGAIRRTLAIEACPPEPHYRVLRQRPGAPGRYACHSSFALETEEGIQAVLHLFGDKVFFHLPSWERVTLYVPHLSSESEAAAGALPQTGGCVFALDPRGIGQSLALTCRDENFFSPYGADFFYASYALMLNRPYLGRRVHDLLSALELLRRNGCRAVRLHGRGHGALIAAFAACLHPVVKLVTLENALLSYYELTQNAVQSWPLSFLAPGVLARFDLPDCYRALKAKRLKLVSPWNCRMQLWNRRALLAHARSLRIDPKIIKNKTTR